MIIKTGQVTQEELVKQIDHVNKIRGDTLWLLKYFKGLLPLTTTLLIVPHPVFFYKANFIKTLSPSIPSLASASDQSLAIPREKHSRLT